MKLEVARFARSLRLPPGLDDVFDARKVQSADQAANLASLAVRRSSLNVDSGDMSHIARGWTLDSQRERLHAGADR